VGTRLFVGNLSFDTSDDDLRNAFAQAGSCASASVVRDRMTGRSRGFGFVEMSSQEDAQRAITSLNGKDLQGRAMNVSEARERGSAPSAPRMNSFRSFSPPEASEMPSFRRDGGSRRGLRARKRSL
jgi:RNA recognition motif-containing protein